MKKVVYSAPLLPLEPMDKEGQTAELELLIRQIMILKSQIDVLTKVFFRSDKKGVCTGDMNVRIMHLSRQAEQI